ncbi:MAG: hypothetical protein HY308_11225 [Gammaproteobacteria bacterium]|nr:hypothetical protein [Gammaproteobacteria bacterium]
MTDLRMLTSSQLTGIRSAIECQIQSMQVDITRDNQEQGFLDPDERADIQNDLLYYFHLEGMFQKAEKQAVGLGEVTVSGGPNPRLNAGKRLSEFVGNRNRHEVFS